MVTSILDNDTRAYFASEAACINFIGQDHRTDSIKRRLLDAGVDIRVTKVLQFGDRVSTVYSFGRSAAALDVLKLDGVADAATVTPGADPDFSETDTDRKNPSSASATTAPPIYAVEWGISSPSEGVQRSYQYVTLFFDSEPTACDVDRAYEIQLFESDLRFGRLEITFDCQECGARTHWLSVPRCAPDPTEVPLHVRRELIEDRRCGCTGIADTAADTATEEAYKL